MAVARRFADWDFIDGGSGATHVYTSTGNTLVAGDVLEGIVSWVGSAESVVSIVDDKGNTYTLVDDITSGTVRGRSFYKQNISGGANPQFTVTYTGSVSSRKLGIRALSGAATSGALVANVANPQASPGTGTNAITSTAQTPSAPNAWVSGWCSGNPIIGSAGTSVAFTLDSGIGFPAGETMAAEHIIQTSAVSVAATFTSTGSPADTLTFLMAFKPPDSGTPLTPAAGAGTMTGAEPGRVASTVVIPATP